MNKSLSTGSGQESEGYYEQKRLKANSLHEERKGGTALHGARSFPDPKILRQYPRETKTARAQCPKKSSRQLRQQINPYHVSGIKYQELHKKMQLENFYLTHDT
jgi:hypothetical protein